MSIEFEKNIYYAAQAGQTPGSFSLEETFKKEVKENLQFTYGNVTCVHFRGYFDREYGMPMTYSVNQDRKDAELYIRLKAIPGALWAVVKTIYHLACALFIGGLDAFNGDTDTAKVYAFYAGRHCIEILGRVFSLYDPEVGQFFVEESQFHETCYDLFFEAKAKMAQKVKEVNDLIHNGDKSSKKTQSKGHVNDEKPLDPSQRPNFAEKLENIKSGKDRKIKDEAFLVLAEDCLLWDDLDMGLEVIKEIYSSSFIDRREKFMLKLVNRYIELGNEEEAIEILGKIYSSKNTSAKEAVYFTLAEKHIAQKNEKRGIELLGRIHSVDGRKRKNEIIFNLANERLANGDEDGGLKLLGTIYSSDYKDRISDIYFKFAKERLANKDEIGCEELLGKINIIELSEMKNQIYFELAEKNIADENMTKALGLLAKIRFDKSSTSRKENLIFKIAQWYFDQGQMNEAIKVVSRISVISDKEEEKAGFITKVANIYGLDQLKKALEIMGSVKKDFPASQKFYLDQIERYCPQGEGHDEAIYEIARAFAVDSCYEYLIKKVSEDLKSGKVKDLTFAVKMNSKENILSKFQGIDTSNYCSLIREKYEAKGRDGISEALAEIASSLQSLY